MSPLVINHAQQIKQVACLCLAIVSHRAANLVNSNLDQKLFTEER